MVSVDEFPAVTDDRLNVAVAPDGSPLAARETVPAEPEVTAVPTVVVAEEPGATVPEVGLSDMEKSLPGVEVQPGSVNEDIRVFQLKLPLLGMYSCVYQ